MTQEAPPPEAPPDEGKGSALAEKIDQTADTPAKVDPAAERRKVLHAAIEAQAQHFAVALAAGDGTPMIDPKKFARVAYTAVRKNPMLQEASLTSLMGALMACAQLGLEPSGPLGQAYLVPFREKGQVEVQLIIGYQGLIELAYRSGRVTSIVAHVVRSNDHFEWELGTNAHIVHRPAMTERGEVTGAYAIANIAGGGQVFDVMARSDIDARRARAKTDKIWTSDFEAMARKTAVRQLFKWLPASVEDHPALGADGGVFRQIPEKPEDFDDPNVIDVDEVE